MVHTWNDHKMWYMRIPTGFPPLASPAGLAPTPRMPKSALPVAGPGEVVPTLSRPGERAEPAPKYRAFRSDDPSGAFEGQRQDRRAIADRVATYGLRVFCTDCGRMHRHRGIGGERLRNIPSVCCGARMRPSRWRGWAEWRRTPRPSRREEPAPLPDPYVRRCGGEYFMRGFDS